MKPTKKKAAKRKYSDLQTMLIGKLIDLKYRINDAYREDRLPEDMTRDDKSWVMEKCDDVRNGGTLSKGELMKANKLWKDYNPSRLENWTQTEDNYTTPSGGRI